MGVRSQTAIANVLVDLNLAVWYGIAIHTYVSKKFWRILIWQLLRQSAKLPNLIPRQIFRLYSSTSGRAYVSFLAGCYPGLALATAMPRDKCIG